RLERLRHTAGCPDLVGHGVRPGFPVNAVDGHRHPVVGQPVSDDPPEPTGAPGHECDPNGRRHGRLCARYRDGPAGRAGVSAGPDLRRKPLRAARVQLNVRTFWGAAMRVIRDPWSLVTGRRALATVLGMALVLVGACGRNAGSVDAAQERVNAAEQA